MATLILTDEFKSILEKKEIIEALVDKGMIMQTPL